jgi:hypothetical protein
VVDETLGRATGPTRLKGVTKSNALTDHQVEPFIEDGFVHLGQVVPAEVVSAGQQVIWSDLGQSPDDPSSWTEPVVPFHGPGPCLLAGRDQHPPGLNDGASVIARDRARSVVLSALGDPLPVLEQQGVDQSADLIEVELG